MKIKEKVSRMIHEAIDNFDFEEALEEALDNINIEQLVESKLSAKVQDIDIESMMESLIKDYIDEVGGISGGMQRYLKFLPNYKWDSLNNAKYRVVVEFYRTKDDNDYLSYSTFEVKK